MYVGGTAGSVHLFKQSKLSLTSTLARGNCEHAARAVVGIIIGTLERHIALHASQNIARLPKRLVTVQAIEYSAVVYVCKISVNSYH